MPFPLPLLSKGEDSLCLFGSENHCVALPFSRSMKVNLFRVKGKNYGLVISDLFSPIVPEQSSVRVMAMLYKYIHVHSYILILHCVCVCVYVCVCVCVCDVCVCVMCV